MNESMSEDNSINVYHVKGDSHTIGWIILSISLTVVVIGLIIWLVITYINQPTPTPCNCFGPFGVQTGIDGNQINRCGTDRNLPCIFNKNSISDCETECNNLANICSAFTYNSITSIMKIVDPNNTFTSVNSNLFVRQSSN